jgi:hypothetical protein
VKKARKKLVSRFFLIEKLEKREYFYDLRVFGYEIALFLNFWALVYY